MILSVDIDCYVIEDGYFYLGEKKFRVKILKLIIIDNN